MATYGLNVSAVSPPTAYGINLGQPGAQSIAGGTAQRDFYATPAALDRDDGKDDAEDTFSGFGTMTSTASGHAAEQFDGFGFDDASPSGTPGLRETRTGDTQI